MAQGRGLNIGQKWHVKREEEGLPILLKGSLNRKTTTTSIVIFFFQSPVRVRVKIGAGQWAHQGVWGRENSVDLIPVHYLPFSLSLQLSHRRKLLGAEKALGFVFPPHNFCQKFSLLLAFLRQLCVQHKPNCPLLSPRILYVGLSFGFFLLNILLISLGLFSKVTYRI